MRSRLPAFLRHHAVALLALFVALTGTAYAAGLPRNSVGSPQIKTGAVKSVDVKDGGLLARDFKAGQLPAGAPGQPGEDGAPGPAALGFERSVAFGGPPETLGTIGPWTLSGFCDFFGNSGFLSATGPGEARITRFTSTNDGPGATAHETYVIDGSHDILGVAPGLGNLGRQTGTVQLRDATAGQPGSQVATVSGEVLVRSRDRPSDAGCEFTGTAVLGLVPPA